MLRKILIILKKFFINVFKFFRLIDDTLEESCDTVKKVFLSSIGFLLENNKDKAKEVLKFLIGMQALLARGYDVTEEFFRYELSKLLDGLDINLEVKNHFLDLVDIGLDLLGVSDSKDRLLDILREAENLVKQYMR